MRWRSRKPPGLAAAVLWLAALAVAPARAEEPAPVPGTDPALLAALDGRLDPQARAEIRFLEHLGWRFVRDPAAKDLVVREGAPCARESLEAARAAGDLVVVLPGAAGANDAQALAGRLEAIIDSTASRCAYLLRVEKALKAALEKFTSATDRGLLVFPKLLVWHSPFFSFRGPDPEWMSDARIHRPSESAARAIEALYERGAVAECFVGQLLLAFAAQYELYGAAGFDQAFRPEDLSVGMPTDLQPTAVGALMRFDSPYRRGALFLDPETQKQDAGLALARLGPKAFVGHTGIVMNAKGGNAANQNVTFVSVSPRANQILLERGGWAYVRERTTEVAEMLRAHTWYSSPSVRKAALAPIEAVFTDPVFTEIQVYCHPFGVVPLGKIVRDEVEENTTPVVLYPYVFGREDAWYQRYRRWWKDTWLRDIARSGRPT